MNAAVITPETNKKITLKSFKELKEELEINNVFSLPSTLPQLKISMKLYRI